MKERLIGIYYTLPVQLVKLQLKHNVLILSLWAMLFLMVNGDLGAYFGVHYFFLDPEYMGKVNFWSFYLIGVTYGSFFIAWNSSIYILNSYRFPFLASLHQPFAKFSFNNFIIPVIFVVFYLGKIIHFQWYNEYAAEYSIVFYCLGFVLGALSMILLSMFYFRWTNTDIDFYRKSNKLKINNALKSLVVRRKAKQLAIAKEDPYQNAWRVDYYLSEFFEWKIVRNVEHYHYKLLQKVFRQNHANAIVIQSISITLLILMGALVEYPYFRIPTAASVFLLFSIMTTMIGAITYWLSEWRILFLLVILGIVSQMMGMGWFSYQNRAFGVDYAPKPIAYNLGALDSVFSRKLYREDIKNTESILENWKNKLKNKEKPKLVIVCVSGGGIRASLWSHHMLNRIDEELGGTLMNHTALITGASGGLWGAAVHRELYYQKQLGKVDSLSNPKYDAYFSKDLANPLVFTFLVNDIFIPWVDREVNGYTYKQDRGYIFEQQFIENTEGLMGMDLEYYRAPEQSAIIPMLLVTPMITNDSRSLVISPQGVSYMTRPPFTYLSNGRPQVDAVDFGALLSGHNPYNMRFMTALRMNGTFPFIFPSVQLPTTPTIQVADAGFRDNYGLESATRFATIFRQWIRENTSGLTIVSIRSFSTNQEIPEATSKSISELIFNPISPAFSLDALQRFHHSTYATYLKSKIGYDKVDIVHFEYEPTADNQHASLGLHLTKREKNDIKEAVYLPKNQKNIEILKELIK